MFGAYIYPDTPLIHLVTMEVQARPLSQKVNLSRRTMLLLPDDVGCCLSLLCQKFWVMHDLFQEADHLAFKLTVGFKVLWEDGQVALATVNRHRSCSTLRPG